MQPSDDVLLGNIMHLLTRDPDKKEMEYRMPRAIGPNPDPVFFPFRTIRVCSLRIITDSVTFLKVVFKKFLQNRTLS